MVDLYRMTGSFRIQEELGRKSARRAREIDCLSQSLTGWQNQVRNGICCQAGDQIFKRRLKMIFIGNY